MTPGITRTWSYSIGKFALVLGASGIAVSLGRSEPETTPAPRIAVAAPAPTPVSPPEVLSLADAVQWALQYNPEITAQRSQRGIAAAGVVIARTYPFNPVWESSVRNTSGPTSAGITNRVALTDRVGFDVEVKGQRRIREQGAAATLSRTEWDVATQELALAVRVERAFDTVTYRYRKRQLIETTIALNERAAQLVADLVKAGRLNPVDEIVIQTEVQDARALLTPGQASLVVAWQDLYRTLGLTDGTFSLQGGLEIPPPREDDVEVLVQAALLRRPDLRSRQLAVDEAESRLQLEIANRYGNPNIGPSYEYNETRVHFIGAQIALPLPIFNTHRGDIQQRAAERAQAALLLRQNEFFVRQDVHAALARLEQARRWLTTYRRDLVPSLEKALKDIITLFEARAAGVDLLRVIDVQRKLLHARDLELDAAFEVRMSLADLAAAVGDPSLAMSFIPHP
jgi:outer membrane protein TolC